MLQYSLPPFPEAIGSERKQFIPNPFQSKATLTGYQEPVRSFHGGQSFRHGPNCKMGGRVSERNQSSQRTMSTNWILTFDCAAQSLPKCVLPQNALSGGQKIHQTVFECQLAS